MITGSSHSFPKLSHSPLLASHPFPHCPLMEKMNEITIFFHLPGIYHFKKNNAASSVLQLVDDTNTTRKVMHYALKPGRCFFVWNLALDYYRPRYVILSVLHDLQKQNKIWLLSLKWCSIKSDFSSILMFITWKIKASLVCVARTR